MPTSNEPRHIHLDAIESGDLVPPAIGETVTLPFGASATRLAEHSFVIAFGGHNARARQDWRDILAIAEWHADECGGVGRTPCPLTSAEQWEPCQCDYPACVERKAEYDAQTLRIAAENAKIKKARKAEKRARKQALAEYAAYVASLRGE